MPEPATIRLYRFGIFELDAATGELRRKGVRVKLHAQPIQILVLLLERPGQMLTREELCRELWPDGTFVDYEHGVNSAINRLREALGDKAANPRFVETLARRGYRFIASVETIGASGILEAVVEVAGQSSNERERLEAEAVPVRGGLDSLLATPADLPATSHTVVQTLFVMLQLMYVGFYVGALANLREINELFSPLPHATEALLGMIATAALLIPVRTFLICAALFRAPGMQEKFRKVWRFLLPMDALWALAPFLLLHHMNYGLALACTTLLVYSPFAQRSLVLMGAGFRPAKDLHAVKRTT